MNGKVILFLTIFIIQSLFCDIIVFPFRTVSFNTKYENTGRYFAELLISSIFSLSKENSLNLKVNDVNSISEISKSFGFTDEQVRKKIQKNDIALFGDIFIRSESITVKPYFMLDYKTALREIKIDNLDQLFMAAGTTAINILQTIGEVNKKRLTRRNIKLVFFIDLNGKMRTDINSLQKYFSDFIEEISSGYPVPLFHFDILSYRFNDRLSYNIKDDLTISDTQKYIKTLSCYGGVNDEINLMPLFNTYSTMSKGVESSTIDIFLIGSKISIESIYRFESSRKNSHTIFIGTEESDIEELKSLGDMLGGFSTGITYHYNIQTEYRKADLILHKGYLYLFKGIFTDFFDLSADRLEQIYFKKIKNRDDIFNIFSSVQNEKIIRIIKKDDNLVDSLSLYSRRILRKLGVSFDHPNSKLIDVLLRNEKDLVWLKLSKKTIKEIYDYYKGDLKKKSFYLGCSIRSVNTRNIIISSDRVIWTPNRKYLSEKIIIDFASIFAKPDYFFNNGILPEKLWFFKVSIEDLNE